MGTRISTAAVILAAILLASTLLAPGTTFACDLEWALYPTACGPAKRSAELVVSAGDYGTFYFTTAPGTLGACTNIRGGGSETPRIYPPAGPAPEEPICLPGNGCDDTLDQARKPWIALVDWEGWHALAVDALVRGSTAKGVQTVLLPLRSNLGACPGVTDADVLVELARITQAVDRKGTPPPLAINMSFGRRSDANKSVCDKSTLACQISRLLSHLTHDPTGEARTVAVAAAGNHRELLFPASLGQVLAVGSLDLTRLAKKRRVEPSWETPPKPEPRALMPGSGFCLELEFTGGPRRMAVPSGTSFAAAIFTGWLSEALIEDRAAVVASLLKAPRFEPRPDCSGGVCAYRLAQGTTLFSTPGGSASDRVREAVEDDLILCGPSVKSFLTATLKPTNAQPLARPSLVELTTGRHRPTPEPNPCVPCSLCCESSASTARGGFSAPAPDLARTPGALVALAPGPSAIGSGADAEVDLTLDLHTGWPLDDGTTELVGLYLRFSPHLMELDLPPDQLAEIADGRISFLRIFGTLPSPDFDRQPSLIALLRRVAPAPPELFWNATPIVLRPDSL